jgi:hypothetical protein
MPFLTWPLPSPWGRKAFYARWPITSLGFSMAKAWSKTAVLLLTSYTTSNKLAYFNFLIYEMTIRRLPTIWGHCENENTAFIHLIKNCLSAYYV